MRVRYIFQVARWWFRLAAAWCSAEVLFSPGQIE